jgi:hypothetical protein
VAQVHAPILGAILVCPLRGTCHLPLPIIAMNVAQLVHELALIAHIAVVVALLPKNAGGMTQVSAQNPGANLGHQTYPVSPVSRKK